MSGWLVPSLAYILLIGGLGVTTKLALRDLGWQDIIVWTAVVYAVIAVGLVALAEARIGLTSGAPWAIASAVLASTGLIALFVALGRGESSQVIPLTSAYPVVTLVLSALVLSERLTVLRVLAAGLVVLGVALLSLGR